MPETASPELREALEAVSAFANAPTCQCRAIGRAVDALITLLDVMDGDPDAEENGDVEYDCADMEHMAWAAQRLGARRD